jgi:phage terminase large subunit GpA-like protein
MIISSLQSSLRKQHKDDNLVLAKLPKKTTRHNDLTLAKLPKKTTRHNDLTLAKHYKRNNILMIFWSSQRSQREQHTDDNLILAKLSKEITHITMI